ncbi:hypothetical protein MMC30_004458 [Trapelia coarctata]|nr:hypothetical protein [Trapelia coarctata]
MSDHDVEPDYDDLMEARQDTTPFRCHYAHGLAKNEAHGTYIHDKTLDNEYVLPKINFVHIAGWDTYLHFTGVCRRTVGDSFAIDVAKAHVIFRAAAIKDISLVFPITNDYKGPSNLSEEQTAALKKDVDSGFLAMITIHYDPEKAQYTGFETSRDHDKMVQLERMYRADSEVRYVFRAHNQNYDAWLSQLEQTETANAFEAWYPNHEMDPFIQIGDYPDAEDRPVIRIPASPVFKDFNTYLTVLGFAIIQEAELDQKLRGEVEKFPMEMVMVEVPGTNGNRIYGVLRVPKDVQFRFEPEERLQINFNTDIAIPDDAWSAWVLGALPFSRLGKVSVLCFRPYDHTTNEYDRTELNVILAKDIEKTPDLAELLAAKKGTRVIVSVKYSPKVLKSQIHALRHLQLDGSDSSKFCGCPKATETVHPGKYQPLRRFLTGVKPKLTTVNIHEGLSNEALTVLNNINQNRGQIAVTHYCQNVPNGIGVINNPPGTGKTQTIVQITLPFCYNAGTPSSQSNNRQVLVVTPDNLPADGVAERLYITAQSITGCKDAIIVRVYAQKTEDDHIHHVAKPSPPSTAINNDEVGTWAQMSALFKLRSLYFKAISRPHASSDRRFQVQQLSLSVWMLRIVGYILWQILTSMLTLHGSSFSIKTRYWTTTK